MVAEDGADMGAVVVAVVQGLDDHDAEVNSRSLALIFGFEDVVRRDAACCFDQLIPAAGGMLPQHIKAGDRLSLIDLSFAADQPREITLLGGEQMVPGPKTLSILSW